jgi:hypothetical protein
MNVQRIAQVNTVCVQLPTASRVTGFFLAVVLLALVISMSLVYLVVGGIAIVLR